MGKLVPEPFWYWLTQTTTSSTLIHSVFLQVRCNSRHPTKQRQSTEVVTMLTARVQCCAYNLVHDKTVQISTWKKKISHTRNVSIVETNKNWVNHLLKTAEIVVQSLNCQSKHATEAGQKKQTRLRQQIIYHSAYAWYMYTRSFLFQHSTHKTWDGRKQSQLLIVSRCRFSGEIWWLTWWTYWQYSADNEDCKSTSTLRRLVIITRKLHHIHIYVKNE